MKRLIYAEDAMRRIEAETRFYSGTYVEIERAIDTAPTVDPEPLRPAAEWISVGDRLPDFFDEVIVYDNCGFKSLVSTAWRRGGDNGGWIWDSRMSYPEELVNITHWMPLPQPPKTENVK